MLHSFDAVDFTLFLNVAFENFDIRLVDEFGNEFYPSGVNPARLVVRAGKSDQFRLDLFAFGLDYVGAITFMTGNDLFEVVHYTETDEVEELLEQFSEGDY